jgi:hypothetical protein
MILPLGNNSVRQIKYTFKLYTLTQHGLNFVTLSWTSDLPCPDTSIFLSLGIFLINNILRRKLIRCNIFLVSYPS